MELKKRERMARATARLRRDAPWIVLAVSLAATVAYLVVLSRLFRARDETRFQAEAVEAKARVLDRLERYKAAARGAAGLFSALHPVTPAEFSAFVRRQNVRVLYPGLLGMGWSPAGGDVDTAYAEPGGLIALPALAPGRRAARQEAMEVARDRGGAQTTPLLPMSLGAPRAAAGFLLYLPVYSSDAFPPRTLAERRRQLVGFVYAPVLADALFGEVLSGNRHLRMAVYDGAGVRRDALFYTSSDASASPSRYRDLDTLAVTGRAWTIVLESTPAFEAQLAEPTVAYAAAVGLMATLLLTALAWSLSRAAHAADAANRAKSAFLATMSHELRTPLNAIVGYADLLDMGVPEPVGPRAREQVGRIQAGARHLLELIDAVLQFARTEARIEAVSVAWVDLDELVRSVVDLTAPLAARKGLTLQHHPRGDGGYLVRTDAAKLRQIGINLVGNAIKFTPEGEVRIETAQEGQEVVVRVSDTGIGIAPEHQELVFGAFWQGDRSLTRSVGGAGLGLAVSRNLARLLGGELTCESQQGRGSTFTLRLPVDREI